MNKKMIFLTIITIGYWFSLSGKNKAYLYFNTTEKNVNSISFSRNCYVLAIPDGKTIKLFDATNQDLRYEFTGGHTHKILALKISNDSTLLLSAGMDSSIVIWDLLNRNIKDKISNNGGIISTIDITNDNKYLAFASTDKVVTIYDLSAKKIISTWNKNSSEITTVKFSPNGKLLAIAGSDSYIYLYDVITGKMIQILKGHRNWVRDVVFSDTGNEVTSCGDDSHVISWNISDLRNFEIIYKKKLSFTWLLSVDRYNSNFYATGDIDGLVEVFGESVVYSINLGVTINKILFKQNKNGFLTLAIATRGKGVFIIESMDMNVK